MFAPGAVFPIVLRGYFRAAGGHTRIYRHCDDKVLGMYGDWVIMLAAALIAARATRLATRDVITKPVRDWVARRIDRTEPDEVDHEPGTWEAFASCPWCIGWWITITTFACAYLVWPGHDWTGPQVIVWIAAAAGTNLVYASAAAVTARVRGLADTLELSILRRPWR